MNIKKIYFLIIAVSLATMAFAQTSSPYSRYGLGSFQQKGSERVRTMGGAGIALQGKTDVNNTNPSSLVDMDSTAVLFDMGFHANASNFSSGSTSETVFSGNIDYVSLAIPMHKRWFFAASVQPVTSVGYNVTTVAKYNKSDPSAYYDVNYNGEGGMSLASATNSFKLPWGISIGAEVGYMWGNQTETVTESYGGMDISYTQREDILYHKGLWVTTGAQYKLSLDKSSFILGATYQLPTTVTSSKENTIVSSQSSIEDKTGNTEKNKMAETYGFGISYSYDNKLTFSTDYSIHKWAGAGFGIDPQRLTDNQVFSLGGEYQPNSNSNNYLDRMSYRVGAHYETGSFEISGDAVQSAYVSFGVGLPGRINSTLISVGFELGTIGGFNSKHISETYGQVNIGLNLGEVWFVKPKFW